MTDLMHSHWFPLVSQGNIYSLTTLRSSKGTNKLLVASLKRKIYSFEFDHSKWQLKPVVKELVFTYIPNGAEIIAIDAYNKSKIRNEFVIGITITKTSSETSIERYLNIYTEGMGDGEDISSLESIAQNCLMVELSYTPYLLYHTIIPQSSRNEIIWLISGNDKKIHMITEDKHNHSYTESQLEKYFPELYALEAIALWIDIYYFENFKKRLTAISCECGLLKLAKVNVELLEIIHIWILRYNNPICNVKIFPSQYEIKKSDFLNINYEKKKVKLNVLFITGNVAVLFQDILNQSMFSDLMLCGNEITSDCIMCSCVADINLDGKNEILLGTYKHEVLTYASKNNTWKMIDKKQFDSPIYSITYVDLVGDGIKVLVILTQRSVHIMQYNPKWIMKKWKKKFYDLKLLSK